MIYLTVTAHPDDEVLGFGATSKMLSMKGHKIYNLILSGQVDARRNKPTQNILELNCLNAQKIIGAEASILGNFPNIKFNTIPHLELVRFIEEHIEKLKPDYIFTHHPYDLNNDHYHTSKACQAASRLFQRKKFKPLKGLYFMEIPSSTDWAFPVDGQVFIPDTYFEIGMVGLEAKLEGLNAYEGIMRQYPHPRSNEAIKSLACLRGSESGLIFAEAFQTAFKIMEP